MKAYFVDNDTEELFELTESKKKQLEKKHPNWIHYNVESHPEELNDVHVFFKKYGKKVAGRSLRNIFVGLTV